jgi:radical SAM protein with 4Fe4S-binding SPASM domain
MKRTSKIKNTLAELRFVRSVKDLKILYDKLQFYRRLYRNDYHRPTVVPLSLQIEPTNHCNVRCSCCSRQRMKRAKGYMDFQLFSKIVDEASQAGIKRVELYLHGEPLMHPEIARMMAYLQLRQVSVNLTSNGMLLDSARSAAILKSYPSSAAFITVSVLGASAEVHEKTMKGVNHDRVTENIHNFLKLRKQHKANGPIIQTIFYRLDENANEADQYAAQWQNVVDHANYTDTISQAFARRGSGDGAIPIRDRICTQVFRRMIVYWNGDVTICCNDIDGDHVVGNLERQSIREIWNCPKMASFRKISIEKRFASIPLCEHCDM